MMFLLENTMFTSSAKAAGTPANSGIHASEANEVTPRYETRNRKQTVRYGHEGSASSGSSQMLGDGLQNHGIARFSFANASNIEILRTLLARAPRKLAGSSGSTNGNSKRQKAPLSKALDLDESESDTQSAADPPKRQRRQTATEKAESRATAANIQKSLPEPRGMPEVWADVGHSPPEATRPELTLLQDRQSLCESLQYFQSFKSGTYHSKGYGYGWLLDNDNDERGYMDGEISISRL